MKTRTTLTGLFAMLARPLLDALRDECSVWRKHGSHGRDDYNSPAGVDREATLEPSPAAMPEPVMNISFMTAAEPAPVALTEPVMTFSVITPAEVGPAATPEPAVELVALTTPALATVEQAAPVAVPEPVLTVAAGVKCEPKPANRTRKPALAMAGASRTTTKKRHKLSRTEPAGKVPEGSSDGSKTTKQTRKPATHAKRTPACSTT